MDGGGVAGRVLVVAAMTPTPRVPIDVWWLSTVPVGPGAPPRLSTWSNKHSQSTARCTRRKIAT